MASYLMKYKGTYRLRSAYDIETNQYPRKLDGTLEDIDVYIDCYKGIQITHFGKSILQVWIPSAVRGRNIVKDIESKLGGGICFDIRDNETELLFKFHSKHMEQLEELLKPKTGGASTSPFSNKNLPKGSYTIPEEDLSTYKSIVSNVPKNQLILISHCTKDFLKSINKKKGEYEKLKADMTAKGIKGKEYIHSIGKWESYIKYLNKNLKIGE